MLDRELVAAIAAGETEGLAGAYDRYAPGLYAYCRSLLGEPADAADAVQDTFIIAATKLGGLRNPDRLRTWLYAVARNECWRRLRSRAHHAPLEAAGEMTGETAGPESGTERAELRSLVGAALAGLNPGDREVITLNLRHELDGADLADALGVSRNQAHALASRARSQFETALAALLVARTGRGACQELDTMLAGWDGQLTILVRKRVSRHIGRCATCGTRKRRELSPAMLLSISPVAVLPPALRDQILRLAASNSPSAAAYRSQVASRAEPSGQSGFPRQISRPRPARGPTSRMLAAAAAAAGITVAGGGAAVAANLLHHQGTPAVSGQAASTASGPAGRTSAASPSAPGTAAAPATAPAPSPSGAPATASPPATVPASATASPPATVSASATASPLAGTLVVSPAAPVTLAPTASGPYAGTFTLTAQGGPVTAFQISVAGVAGRYLTVTPAAGSLAEGQSVTVTVTAPAGAKLPYQSDLTAAPGGLAIVVVYPPSG